MKTKTTKLFLSIFAFAALAITACSGGGNSDDSSSSSSSSSSTEPGPGPEPGPEPEEGTQYTGEVEYGTFAGKVYAYAFDSLGDYLAVEAETEEDTKATFVLPEDSDYEGLVMVELNPDAEDFDGSDWSEVAKKSLDLDMVDLDPESFSFELRNCVEAGDPDTDMQVWGTNGHAGGTEWGKVGDIVEESGSYKVSVQLYVGSKIVFHLDGDTWLDYDSFANTNSRLKFARESDESGNAVSQVRELIEFTINSSASGYIISIGGEVPVPATYYLVGTHNQWGETDLGKTLTRDDNDYNHYTSARIPFADGAKIKVNDGTNWYANASEGKGYTIDSEGNVVVTEAGHYYVNFYVNSEPGNHITLDREYSYTVSIGGVQKALVKNTEAKLEAGQTGEYMLETPFEGVTANAPIVFAGASDIVGHIGLDGNDTTPSAPKYNNAVVVPESSPAEFKIRDTSTENVQVYLKTWNNGYSFFITGGAPLTLGYNLYLNGVDLGEVQEVEKAQWPEGTIGEYKVSLANLVVGQVFSLEKNGEAIDADHFHTDDGPNNNVSDLRVNISGTKDVYIKLWAGQGEQASQTFYTIWTETPTVDLASIVCKVNGSAASPTPKEPGTDNYKVYEQALTAGQYIEFFHDGDNLFGFYHQTDHAVFDGTRYTATATGTFTFYLNKEYKIYVDGPVSTKFRVIGLDSWAYEDGEAMTAYDTDKGSNVLHQWKYAATFDAGKKFKLFDNVETYLGYDQLENKTLFQADADRNIVFNYAGTYTIYLKLLTNNTYQIYISCDTPTPANADVLSWDTSTYGYIYDANAVVLAWVSGGSSGDEWVEVTVKGESSVAVVKGTHTTITLARFPEGTTPATASWNTAAGKFTPWNQTNEDMTESGTVTWRSYTPSAS